MHLIVDSFAARYTVSIWRLHWVELMRAMCTGVSWPEHPSAGGDCTGPPVGIAVSLGAMIKAGRVNALSSRVNVLAFDFECPPGKQGAQACCVLAEMLLHNSNTLTSLLKNSSLHSCYLNITVHSSAHLLQA